MPGKTDKQFLFEVQMNWLADTRGVLSAKDAKGIIHVATPPEFGGKGKPWTPEHLFLSSLSSCFMTTYLAFARKSAFDIFHLECSAIGQIELINGKYKFTIVNLYPKVYIDDESLRAKAEWALEKTHKYCLIANSVNAEIIYHSGIYTRSQYKEEIKTKPALKISFLKEDAKEIGERLGIDFEKYSLDEFKKGLEVELEHGKKNHETNITNDNEYMTGKIAWAHLREIPDYYTRLDKMEKEAEAIAGNFKINLL